MNDSAIIKIISNIHTTIVSFLLFILVSMLFLFVSLLNGIHVDRFILSGVKIEALYINWDEKLRLSASKIEIKKKKSTEETAFELKDLKKLIKLLSLYNSWFEAVDINSLIYNDIELSFNYLSDDTTSLNARSPMFKLDSNILFGSKYTLININSLKADQQNSSMKGSVVFDNSDITLYLKIEAVVANSADLRVYGKINTQEVSFNIEGINPIKKLAPIVDLFHLHKDVVPWIVDYSDGSFLNLHRLNIRYEYDKPETLLQNIYASFDYDNFVYTFQPGLEPIRTGYTDFIFENGVLKIMPRHASYCGQNTENSWLDIDFNPDDEPLLTAYLRSSFVLNDDILFLLNYFKIELPFKQITGNTDANLVLKVPLLSVDVEAKGQFHVNQGLFLYKGIELNITNSSIEIHNSKVDVNSFNTSFQDLLQTSAKGYLNFSTHKTDLRFKAEKFQLTTDDLSINLNSNKNLYIDYKLSSKSETLSFSPSDWNISNKNIKIGAFKAPFDFETFSANIPLTKFTITDILSSYISGNIDLTDAKYYFDMKIEKFSYDDLNLNQDELNISIEKNSEIKLSTHKNSRWLIDKTPLTVEPFHIEFNNALVSLKNGHFSLDDVVETDINGSYNLHKNYGSFLLNNFTFYSEKIGNIFSASEHIKIDIRHDNSITNFNVEKLNMYFKIIESGWLLNFYSLEPLSKNSDLLQEYNITKGAFSVASETGSYPFTFKGYIDYPYSILIEDDIYNSQYNITGTLNKNHTIVKLNSDVDITIDENIYITSNNIGFNLPEIVRYLHDHQDNNKSKSKHDKSIYIEADNTFLALGSDRRALADRLSLQYENGLLNAKLSHNRGEANIELKDDDFKLYGKEFGELFTSNLFKSSQFKGGNFSFFASGNLNKFDGIIKFEDTTIRNYALLNNLLAFINTIPALVTFSLPKYSKSGFKLNEAYADLSYQNKILYINSINIDGKEMDIFGKGEVNYNTDNINMELSVKTQAGSNFGKIPLIGYILVGDDETAMTSFTLNGNIDDPEIKHKMAKDIVIAPFNIVKRALNLPFKLFTSSNEDVNNSGEGLQILNKHLNK